MAEAGRRSTHPATAPSQLFHKEKMLAGTWHPSETLRAARGEQKALLALRNHHRALGISLPRAGCSGLQRGWSRAGQSRWLQSGLETRGFQTAA